MKDPTYYRDREFRFLSRIYRAADKREIVKFLDYWDEPAVKVSMRHIFVPVKVETIELQRICQ